MMCLIKYRLRIGLFLIFLTGPQTLLPQTGKILKSIGNAAVMTPGLNQGIQRGSYYKVYRLLPSGWKPLSLVQVTRTAPKLARVDLVPMAPQIRLTPGDRLLPYKKSNLNKANDRLKCFYIGPAFGLFLPLGDMEESYETTFCYGGVVGLRFRPDLDVITRFLYSTHRNDVSLWNVQIVGRRYNPEGFIFDLGYGILYPQIPLGGAISLGFCGGLGYSFPVAFDTRFEMGLQYSYYPHFVDDRAQFITLELRLIL